MSAAIRKERTELMVGLFVFFGLAIMGTLIVQFGRFSDRLKEKYRIEVTFPDASDIREGSPVKLAGQKIGFVAAEPILNEKFTGVTVPIDIYGGKRVPIGSDFAIGTSGLMGDTFIKITMPKDPELVYLQDGAIVEGGTKSGLDALQDDAEVLLTDIREAVTDIRSAVQSLDRVFVKIEGGLLDEENLKNFKVTLSEIKQTGENFNKASQKLDPLLEETKATVAEAKTAMTKAGETFDKAKEIVGKAEPAMEELKPTIAELRQTLEKAQGAIDKITNGNGATAALISDTDLRKDLESFVAKLDQYGILGYPKNKPSAGASAGSAAESKEEDEKGFFNLPFFKRKR